MATRPRDLIRTGLPLSGLTPVMADRCVEECFRMYATDPDRRDLSAHILTYTIMMANGDRPTYPALRLVKP